MTAAAPSATRPRPRWLVPAGLIALALVPLVTGSARLVQLSGGAAAFEPPRSVEAPAVLVVHIVSALLFAVVGAFQFAGGSRGRRSPRHRVTGRIVAPAGLVAASSGLWLTLVITEADGALLTAFRASAGIGMAAAIVLGVAAVLRRDLRQHRAWLMRGYALGLGAGTQVFTAGLWLLASGVPGPTGEALFMGAGWAINLAVVEWLIRRRPSRRPGPAPAVGTAEPARAGHA